MTGRVPPAQSWVLLLLVRVARTCTCPRPGRCTTGTPVTAAKKLGGCARTLIWDGGGSRTWTAVRARTRTSTQRRNQQSRRRTSARQLLQHAAARTKLEDLLQALIAQAAAVRQALTLKRVRARVAVKRRRACDLACDLDRQSTVDRRAAVAAAAGGVETSGVSR